MGKAAEAQDDVAVRRRVAVDISRFRKACKRRGELAAAKLLEPAPAVMMLTNYVDAYQRLRCEAAGADFFLDKSKQFEHIPGILRGLMEHGVPQDG